MIYLFPYFGFGTVNMVHYNNYLRTLEREFKTDVNYQRVGFGGGIGIGYRYSYFDGAFLLSTFTTSSSNRLQDETDRVFTVRTLEHRVTAFSFAFPVGISYPLVEVFSVYAGVKPAMSFSTLRVYDSLYRRTDIIIVETVNTLVADASLPSSSFSLAALFGGDLHLSQGFAFAFRMGYEILTFEGYEGDVEVRVNGDSETDNLHWVYNKDRKEVYFKDNPPDVDSDEVYTREDMSGLRFWVGFKLFLGR